MDRLSLTEDDIGNALFKAAAVLRGGGIVLYPTDTLYGLAADVTNSAAIKKLYELKGREEGKAVLILVEDVASIEHYAVMNEAAKALAKKFLPGALTLVLPAKDTIPVEVTLNGTIGIRVPKDDFCLALAREFGGPFTSTSANIAGAPTLPNVDGIISQLGERAGLISLVIDGGERGSAKPSTVVSCVSDVPVVLREGAISKQELGIES